MVGVARRGHGVEELIEAGNPANILGRGTTGAIHEARVVKRRVGGGDILDRYGMPPVVAEVVGVRESADPAFDQGIELDIFCVKGLVHMIPFSIGYSVSFVADVEQEKVTILKRHYRLNDVVQTLQACGQWDLDTPPNGGIDTVELDADAGDAVRAGHAGDCSLCVAPGERLQARKVIKWPVQWPPDVGH